MRGSDEEGRAERYRYLAQYPGEYLGSLREVGLCAFPSWAIGPKISVELPPAVESMQRRARP